MLFRSPGAFSFAAPAAVPGLGTTNVTVVFTPSDALNYNAANTTVRVAVGKGVPLVALLPASGAITYGRTFADSPLTGGAMTNAGGAPVSGVFAFTTPSAAPFAGVTNASVTFTPTDSTNYSAARIVVPVMVDRALPVVALAPAASGLGYSQAFGASVLSGGFATNAAGFVVPGSFAFSAPSGVPLPGSTNASLTFAPSDAANYSSALSSTPVAVARGVLGVKVLPAAGTLRYGQALGAAVFSGGAVTNLAGAEVSDRKSTRLNSSH